MRLIFPTLIALLSLTCVMVNAQPNFRLMENWPFPNDTRYYQRINKVIGTSNGYLVAVGEAVGKSHKDLDGLFLVINAENGQVVYRKQFGDTSDEYFNSVVQNPDGTLTLVGVIGQNSKSRQKGWLLQIDLEGQIYYEYRSDPRSKGGDAIKDVTITTEGIVMAVGHQNIGMSNDIWLLNIEKNRLTEYLINSADWGPVEAITAGPNGSGMLLGNTGKENRKQPNDAWLLEVGTDGKKLWSSPKYFGDKGYQFAQGITSTLDGGYAFTGVTTTNTAGKSDMWLVKTNAEGIQDWERPIGEADVDEAKAIIELSEGGFALFGQTKSFRASLKTSMMKLILTDKLGTPVVDDIYTLGGADEFGLSMTELYTGDIVIAGASMPLSQQDIPKIYMSAISYKPLQPKKRVLKKEEHFGSSVNTNLKVSAPIFVDPNGNKYLESGERAYVAFELTNTSSEFLNNVGGKISGPKANPGLEFWDNIKLGTLGPGQKKKLIIPVCAQSTLPDGQYQLTVDIDIDGAFATKAQASVESNVPDPAKLIVSGHTFNPNRHPKPGDPIQLRLELSNAGELPTGTVEAYFKLPAGVYSKDSEKVIIPSLRAGSRHQEVFTFFYDNTYLEKAINIGFETKGRASDTFFKNFKLAVAGRNTSPPTAGNSVQMIWLSHDTDDQGGSRSWDTNQRDIPIKIKALSKKKLDKGNFEIYANGSKDQGQKMDEEELTPPMNEAGGGYRQNYSNVVRLQEGRNEIQVVYHNEDGTSYKSEKVVFNYMPTDKPSLYVFSIGVPYSNLKYTVKDAKDIASRFLQMADGKSDVFKNVIVEQFTNDERTSLMSLRKIFAYLGTNNRDKIKEHDLVIIFMSSHGKVDKRGDFILIPSNYDPKVEAVTSLNFKNDVINHLRYLDCKKLVFLDACHSGSAFYSAKSAEEEIASKVMHDLLINEPGLEIFASCDSYELSYEDPSWENGAFTEAMLEALSGESVPINGQMFSADHSTKKDDGSIVNGPDGAITIRELKDFLRKRVPYLVKTVKKGNPTPQNPANKSEERLDQDMRIFTVKKGL